MQAAKGIEMKGLDSRVSASLDDFKYIPVNSMSISGKDIRISEITLQAKSVKEVWPTVTAEAVGRIGDVLLFDAKWTSKNGSYVTTIGTGLPGPDAKATITVSSSPPIQPRQLFQYMADGCKLPPLKSLNISSSVPIFFKSLETNYSPKLPRFKIYGVNSLGTKKEIGFHSIKTVNGMSWHESYLHMDIYKRFEIWNEVDTRLCRLALYGQFVPNAEARALWL